VCGRISSSPGPLYADRSNSGQVTAHFNTNLPSRDAIEAIPFRAILDINCFNSNVKSKYRFMFTTLQERAKALDDRLTNMGAEMITAFNMGDVTPVGVPNADKIKTIGRVCNDAHEGRVNKTSLLLEGNRHEAGGQRVELTVDALQSYSLFPGQIVGVEGMCPAGRKIVADSVCEGVQKPPMTHTASELLKFQYDDAKGQPLSVITAAGPFTTSANLDFHPLVDLLAIVRAKQPDVVILSGPFVDVNHPSVKNGMVQLETEDGDRVTVPFGNIFSEKFVPELERCFEEQPDLKTQFVLVPSLDDAFHDNVFPQPPFADREGGGKAVELAGAEGLLTGSLGLQYVESAGREGKKKSSFGGEEEKRVHCVSNPCTFKINDVVFGVTSIDPIMALNAQDASLKINRMDRMAQHLIMQQSYMPLFPVSSGSGRNVDLRHMDKFSMEVSVCGEGRMGGGGRTRRAKRSFRTRFTERASQNALHRTRFTERASQNALHRSRFTERASQNR